MGDPIRSREDYDRLVATWPADQRWQWWPVPWRLATARERVEIAAVWLLSLAVVAAGALTLILAFDASVDGVARHVEQRDVCLKLATTGHEVVECGR